MFCQKLLVLLQNVGNEFFFLSAMLTDKQTL